MPNEIEILMKLAAIDDEAYTRTEEIQNRPKALDDAEKQLKALQKETVLFSGDIKRVQAEAHTAEVDVKGVEEEIINYSVKLNTIKTNEEYRLITEKIKELKNRKSDIEERAIEFLTEADAFKEQLEEQRKKIEDEQTRIHDLRKEVEETVARLKGEVADLQSEREKLLPEIGPEHLEKYERVRHKLGFGALASIRNGICSGCHMSVRPNTISLVMGGKIMTCQYCNRVLFMGKDDEG